MKSEEPIENDIDILNDKWVEANLLALIQEYPGEWIAVLDQRVISSGITKREAESKAKEEADEREFSLYFIPPVPPEVDTGYTQERRI